MGWQQNRRVKRALRAMWGMEQSCESVSRLVRADADHEWILKWTLERQDAHANATGLLRNFVDSALISNPGAAIQLLADSPSLHKPVHNLAWQMERISRSMFGRPQFGLMQQQGVDSNGFAPGWVHEELSKSLSGLGGLRRGDTDVQQIADWILLGMECDAYWTERAGIGGREQADLAMGYAWAYYQWQTFRERAV